MRTRKTRDLPARLAGVRRRIERWRRTRKARSRIPEPLWASAVEVARTHGIHLAAKALRLSYYALKKRVIEAGMCVSGKRVKSLALGRQTHVQRLILAA